MNIKRTLAKAAQNKADDVINDILKDPVGFFTPHYEKITFLAFSGDSGKWRVSKGESSTQSRKIISICEDASITNGWIAFKHENGRSWIDFSESIPAGIRQRILNIKNL